MNTTGNQGCIFFRITPTLGPGGGNNFDDSGGKIKI